MSDRCERFDRFLEGAPGGGEAAARWRRHLAGCASCREQEAVDALLRRALPAAPAAAPGYEERLRRRLGERLADRSTRGRRRLGLRPAALWALGAYVSAAGAASVVVLARLPWQSLAVPPGLGLVLGAIALLSPLALLDRADIVRPPG